MVIASPSENVYYYECSYGKFRLYYFIPPKELNQLHTKKLIAKQTLKDFPDGVDLGCTEADFRYFKEIYGYRPEQNPEAIRRAFFAILTTTRNWKSFHGSGFISATKLEDHIKEVDDSLLRKKLLIEPFELPPEKLTIKQYRRIKHQQTAQQKRKDNFLMKMKVKGINPKANLAQQEFPRIRMVKGESADKVFNRLLQKKRIKE